MTIENRFEEVASLARNFHSKANNTLTYNTGTYLYKDSDDPLKKIWLKASHALYPEFGGFTPLELLDIPQSALEYQMKSTPNGEATTRAFLLLSNNNLYRGSLRPRDLLSDNVGEECDPISDRSTPRALVKSQIYMDELKQLHRHLGSSVHLSFNRDDPNPEEQKRIFFYTTIQSLANQDTFQQSELSKEDITFMVRSTIDQNNEMVKSVHVAQSIKSPGVAASEKWAFSSDGKVIYTASSKRLGADIILFPRQASDEKTTQSQNPFPTIPESIIEANPDLITRGINLLQMLVDKTSKK